MSKPTIEELENILSKPDDYYQINPTSGGSLTTSIKFKYRLKSAAEQGLLLFTKYFLVALLVYASLQFFNGIVAGSQNGTQSSLYLQELINKGYLPKAGPNGIEPKTETPVAQVK